MRKAIVSIILLLFLNGCGGKMITVPLDPSPLSTEEATVTIFHDQGFIDNFKIFLDDELIGHVTSEVHLKYSVVPGEHELHSEVGVAIDRVTKMDFEAGQTYYMRLWMDFGMFVSSVRIDPVEAIDSYEVRSRRK